MQSEMQRIVPAWLPFGRREAAYETLNEAQGSGEVEMTSLRKQSLLKDPDQEASEPLSRSQSRIHTVGRAFSSIFDNRSKKLQGYHVGVLWCVSPISHLPGLSRY